MGGASGGSGAEEMSGVTTTTQFPPGLAATAARVSLSVCVCVCVCVVLIREVIHSLSSPLSLQFPTIPMAPLIASGVVPTQEQLEAFQKQQLELLATLQKQQQQQQSTNTTGL